MSNSEHLKRQLLRYKSLLANLSRRNRELYFKEQKGSSINLSKSILPKTAYKATDAVNFVPLRSSSEVFNKIVSGTKLNLHDLFQAAALKDSQQISALENRLDKIRLADDKHQREYGISGAWLLGPFLCWRTSPSVAKKELAITPILKLPVNLQKNKRRQIEMIVEEDTYAINPSLCLALKTHLGVEVRDDVSFTSVAEVIAYLQTELGEQERTLEICGTEYDSIPKTVGKEKVRRDESGAVVERKPIDLEEELSADELAIYNAVTPNRFLLIDVVYLDQLNASRAVLLHDYESIIDQGLDHPILTELFNGTSLAEEPPVDRSKLRELDSYSERSNHFVVNIDSTQHRAIDKASQAKAVVIQGPPGTGKSQTITNLIADYLTKGKRVLFVSEKRPALDVVFNRLKQANIESQTVLIHSSDLNKSELYHAFLQLAESSPREADDEEWKRIALSLDQTKSEINEYADTIQKHHTQSGLLITDLMFLAGQTNKSHYRPKLKAYFENIDFVTLKALAKDLEEIQDALSAIPDLKSSPWLTRRQSTIRSTALQHELSQLKDNFERYNARLGDIDALIQERCSEEPSKALKSRIEAFLLQSDKYKQAAGRFAKLWPISSSEVALTEIESIKSRLTEASNAMRMHHAGYMSIDANASPATVLTLENYYRSPRGFSDWFSGAFWSMRKKRKSICNAWDQTHQQFESFRLYRESVETFNAQLDRACALGDKLKIEDLDSYLKLQKDVIDGMEAFIKSIEVAKQLLPQTLYSKILISPSHIPEILSDCAEVVGLFCESDDIHQSIEKDWRTLNRLLANPPLVLANPAAGKTIIDSMIVRLADLDVLDRADLLIEAAAKRAGLDNLKSIIFSELLDHLERWGDLVLSSVLNGWLDAVHSQYSSLRKYERSRRIHTISSFKTLEDQHRVVARQAVNQEFAKRWSSSQSNKSGLPLLRKEATKQKKILSPREIMEKGALETMMALKPCWLMSPLSISQMLPLKRGLFDVIIFDEASQVRVEDAIPSIYRANTMVVVGDTKQMPPTNFFSGAAAEDDEEDDTEISPSVLDLAVGVYPSVMLEWHYRSRAEALIAFSNRAFYGGRLIAAPNPAAISAVGALKHVEVTDAYFSSKHGNEGEAKIVIDQLIQLIRENPLRSYGVIAMGESHAEALEEERVRRATQDPEVRTLLERAAGYKEGDADAGLFIKNLENVQGDERDVILLSVGYAPSAPGKKLYMNFGPLSKKGGGRRLNVAITRAKSSMIVFTSFSPELIATDEAAFTKNADLCIFGRYLKYARAVSQGESGVALDLLNLFPMSGVITNRKSSRFALDVKRRLEENGHHVSAEIGSCGFYIDLAIHHPTLPSSFLLGIECDGAVFHSTPYARDRDKIREDLLKGRGWQIERVMSQDWSKDWRSEILRIETKIGLLLGKKGEKQEGSEAAG